MDVGSRVRHVAAGTTGVVLGWVLNRSPFAGALGECWVQVRNDDDGFEFWAPESALEVLSFVWLGRSWTVSP